MIQRADRMRKQTKRTSIEPAGGKVMTKLPVSGIVFDMYGTIVDVGAVADACRDVAPDPIT